MSIRISRRMVTALSDGNPAQLTFSSNQLFNSY
jgi:hypothetical protein